MISSLLQHLLLLCFFSHSLSAKIITHLPGFSGPLPFHLETGYVGVDDQNGVQLFYYFIESEGNPREDPVLLWLTGGPGCSALSGLIFEIGPLNFKKDKYIGSLPNLAYNPYSWTKASSVIFLDSPVGTGFSFSRHSEGYQVGDITSSRQVHTFLLKWFTDHPQYLANHLYISGDSYAGKVVPVIAEEISKGIEVGYQPSLNLQGYLIGNPVTGENKFDTDARIPFLHGFGIISDELFELATICFEERDHQRSNNSTCENALNVVQEFYLEIQQAHILEPKCTYSLEQPMKRRFVKENHNELYGTTTTPPISCRSDAYPLSNDWANNKFVREALDIQKGSIGEWQRCSSGLSYTYDLPSSIEYHLNLTRQGYRALVYSGDHDAVIPFLGTESWIRSLNFSIVDDWRSWHVNGQVAGYTRTYANNLTFTTVKGGGHTAPEYRPKECLAMLRRWLSHKPL